MAYNSKLSTPQIEQALGAALLNEKNQYNITQDKGSNYPTLAEAIAAVSDDKYKVNGIVLTYNTGKEWVSMRYNGEDASGFSDEQNWSHETFKADDEDLEQTNGLIKFKDRKYDEDNFSGKGYKILRKNIQEVSVPKFDLTISSGCTSDGNITITIGDSPVEVAVTTAAATAESVAALIGAAMTDVAVEGAVVTFNSNPVIDYSTTGVTGEVADNTYTENRNVLTQEMINEANTVYEIRYDFDLNGAEITVPEGCVLRFNEGKFSNGFLHLVNTNIVCDSNHFIFENITGSGSVTNEYANVEWFGAIGYDKSVITDNTKNIIKEGLTDSTNSILNCLDFCYTLNILSIKFLKLYLITDEININTPLPNAGFRIIGNGANSGLLAKINNKDKSVLSINKYDTRMTSLDELKNFSIFVVKTNELEKVYLSSVLYLNETIRSIVEDVYIYGGYSYITNGLFTIHSVERNNVFLNIFNRCKGFGTTTGNGLHYKHETYHPTLQTITNCAFQGLGGCGIVEDLLPITGGGFGGVINGNELEGNSLGSIALGAIGYLTVSNNYFEGNSPKFNFFDALPPCVWTFGFVNENTFKVDNLIFESNICGFSNNSDSGIDYAVLCSGFPGKRNNSIARVRISNNVFPKSTTAKTKYLTYVSNGSIDIVNNDFFKHQEYLDDFLDSLIPVQINTDTDNHSIMYSDKEICAVIHNNNVQYNYKYNLQLHRFDIKRYISSTYPYLQPSSTSETLNFKEGDLVNNTYGKGAYKCIKGGKLHYYTKASFEEGSNIVTVTEGAYWNWKEGDQIQSDNIEGGIATISSVNDREFTLSANAVKTTSDYLMDAVLIPLSDFDLYNRVGSTLPTTKNTHLKIGYQFYSTVDKKVLFWDGEKWTDAVGVDKDVKFNGLYNQKPTSDQNIKNGFQYYCTDKQSPESSEPGLMIYYKGDNVWVDSLGRVVDENYPATPPATSGTTEERPLGVDPGFQYFDTTLKKPIWKTEDGWVDCTGASV